MARNKLADNDGQFAVAWRTPFRLGQRPSFLRFGTAHHQGFAIAPDCTPPQYVQAERQREAHALVSQTAALVAWATTLDLEVPAGLDLRRRRA